MKDFAKRLLRKQSPDFYQSKDMSLVPSLGFWDLLALGALIYLCYGKHHLLLQSQKN